MSIWANHVWGIGQMSVILSDALVAKNGGYGTEVWHAVVIASRDGNPRCYLDSHGRLLFNAVNAKSCRCVCQIEEANM
jgi:hypothetical protein